MSLGTIHAHIHDRNFCLQLKSSHIAEYGGKFDQRYKLWLSSIRVDDAATRSMAFAAGRCTERFSVARNIHDGGKLFRTR